MVETTSLKPKSVIRISLCRRAKRNPNDRFGFNFNCVIDNYQSIFTTFLLMFLPLVLKFNR